MPSRFFLVALLLLLNSAIVFGAEQNLVVVVNKVDDAFIVDARMNAAVKLQTAWDVLNDYDRMHEFVDNLKSSAIFMREGNVFRVRQTGVARFGILSVEFQSEREIRLEPMRRMLVKSLSGPVTRMESETELKLAERGIQVMHRAEIVPDSALARLFGISFIRGGGLGKLAPQALGNANSSAQQHASDRSLGNHAQHRFRARPADEFAFISWVFAVRRRKNLKGIKPGIGNILAATFPSRQQELD